MVRMEIRDFEQDEWNGIISTLDAPSLMQTWEFGEAKVRTGPWKVSRAVFRKDGNILGAAQAMIRAIPFLNRGLVWINRAPLQNNINPAQSDAYLDMLRELKKYWVDKKKMYLRIAPPLIASDENYAIFKEAGYLRITETDGWVSEIVDLSLSFDDLHKSLQQKWRNCLNKAERLKVSCEVGTSAALVDELLDDYKSLLDNKGFNTNLTQEHMRTMQNLLPDLRKMLVFAGRQDGEKLGSICIASYGNTCMYLIGATNNAGRKVNANHYLIWNALCEMKKRGYRWFDVGGAHPDNTPQGILHFKRGLGGRSYQLLGEVEAYGSGFISRMIKNRIESSR
jgi:lipid II:glycine glycyltransferase (peptidoglycan interpeptide bridge formation enzyme)